MIKDYSLIDILRTAVKENASDVHLTVGAPPVLRIDGKLYPLNAPVCKHQQTLEMIYSILNDYQKQLFEENWELDTSIEVKNVGRFRVNVHRQKGHVEAAFRVVKNKIPRPEELGIPEQVYGLVRKPSGLFLITGPTGSGKTTTLASLINLINEEKRCLIITIEDPIEYVHTHKRSIIKQREIGEDTKSFGEALVRALRQDPDVICIGEMRDLETISTALTAAETGHLVLATIHTPDVLQTIDRIIDVFPPHQQNQVRVQLANSLLAILSQKLIPLVSGEGRILACELLIATPAVRKVIRTEKTEQLYTIIQTSNAEGMQTFDQHLKELYENGLISFDEMILHSKFPEKFAD